MLNLGETGVIRRRTVQERQQPAFNRDASTEKASMNQDQNRLIARFGQIWPVHNDAFCDLLVTLRRHFGGDLDRMLVMAIIGSRNLSRGRVEGLSYDRFVNGERAGEIAAINLQSIADYSGIPRETVRRKLQDLEQLGWITRCNKGCLVTSPGAVEDLQPATEATLRYLRCLLDVLSEAMADQKTGANP